MGGTDCELGPLMRLLGRLPGISVLSAVSSETTDDDWAVAFRAESQDCLHAVLSALPSPPKYMELVSGQYGWYGAHVNVDVAGGDLTYTIRLAGWPSHLRRQLVGEIERRLTAAARGAGEYG